MTNLRNIEHDKSQCEAVRKLAGWLQTQPLAYALERVKQCYQVDDGVCLYYLRTILDELENKING